jgi:hypothetical protein
MDYITKEVLESWGACEEGIDLFCDNFEKATLEEISDWCIENKEDDNAIWLFNKCRKKGVFSETTVKGYRNSGDRNSGDRNSGDRNSGDRNSGDRNSGDRNSGYRNSGYGNSGYRNSGDRNSGNWNSGDRNSGDRNSGYRNSGNWNSGYGNSGYRNSGNWNSCSHESGYFNSITDDSVRIFNKRVDRNVWDNAEKPSFIYCIGTTYWVTENEMTEEDKKNDPDFYIIGGQLRKRPYKEAWAIAWDNASDEDRELLKALPGFDADVFEEITGIKV